MVSDEVVNVSWVDEVAVVEVDSPPVNALGIAVRKGLDTTFRQLSSQPPKAIVLICGGRTFFAGADIRELGKPLEQPGLQAVFDIIEASPCPVVAAIHGSALGGGLEIAMVCHARIAVSSAQFGLPEVKLGVLPGAGGTQRTPRLIGAEAALDLMVSGRAVDADEALSLGLIDFVCADRLMDSAIDFAKSLAKRSEPIKLVRDRDEKVALHRDRSEYFDKYRSKIAKISRGLAAPPAIIDAVEAAVMLPFDMGMQREAELFQMLKGSRQAAAMQHVFFAERKSTKIPEKCAEVDALTVANTCVVGAGTMGRGIAMSFLDNGIPITLVDKEQKVVTQASWMIKKAYETSVAKQKLTQAQKDHRLGLLEVTTSTEVVKIADLVIEAVYEELELKKEIFASIGSIAKPEAILASNTSFLDLNKIAEASGRRESVVGLHFFSPANVMQLLEVVEGKHTAPAVLKTAMILARSLGKCPVLSQVGDGFIANRLMRPRGKAADRLVLGIGDPEPIDNAMFEFGFAMGPFRMIDLVGLDVIGRNNIGRTLRGDMVAARRLGQKSGGGFYDYDDEKVPRHSEAARLVITEFAAHEGVKRSDVPSKDEIIARLLFPIVNEGAKILDEGIARFASDLDVAAIFGYGWPRFTGGPMFWADTIGIPKIADQLSRWADETGDVDLMPARRLKEMASSQRGFYS